jgi:hypothetical protein
MPTIGLVINETKPEAREAAEMLRERLSHAQASVSEETDRLTVAIALDATTVAQAERWGRNELLDVIREALTGWTPLNLTVLEA